MATFISILRGINVSGHRKVRMAELKNLYEDAGFMDVKTYIQSGNVIFEAPARVSGQAIAGKLEKAIYTRYGFEIPVIIRTLVQLQQLISSNPFLKTDHINTEKLHVTFLSQKPAPQEAKNLENYRYPPDAFILKGEDVFLHCPDTYGNTKLSNKFFENKLKVKATTRNWKTINKLVALAGDGSI